MTTHNREIVWNSADGRATKIKDMDVGHLVNVINWINSNDNVYEERTRDLMVAEAHYRQLALFAGKRAYPLQVGSHWVVSDPVSGEKGCIPPSQDFLNSVSDNPIYQKMSQNVHKLIDN